MYEQPEKDIRGEETHALDNFHGFGSSLAFGIWISRGRWPDPLIARVRGDCVGL
jgi:hypothetical protein